MTDNGITMISHLYCHGDIKIVFGQGDAARWHYTISDNTALRRPFLVPSPGDRTVQPHESR